MWVWIVFIGGGLGLLIALAIMIGRASAEDHAWRAIAAERRLLNTQRCADCPFRDLY